MTGPAPGPRRVRGGWLGRGRGPARIEVRSRIALIAASAVAIAVLLVSASAYLVVRHDLVSGIDSRLGAVAANLESQRLHKGLAAALAELFHPPTTVVPGPVDQVVAADGIVLARTRTALALPSAPADALAAGRQRPSLSSAVVGGTPVRLLVTGFGRGLALEVAEPVAGVDAELGRLAAVLGVTAGAGILLALGLGAAVAGIALAPVRRLTGAAEELAATTDLSRRIPVEGRDELSRLASSVNALLAALQGAQRAQRQLVADASHELRTPLTSLRTNVEILTGRAPMDAQTRRQLVEDVTAQFDGLAHLVGDLIELARLEAPETAERAPVLVALDVVVDDVLTEMRRLHRGVRIEQDLGPAFVRGVPADLERVVANLVDNAAKWSPPNGVVTVHVSDGPVVTLAVSDQGPGIDPADAPHVFDRFFRGTGGHRVPGSGLGLAIVRRIVEVHGGRVVAETGQVGGARLVVRLPPARAAAAGRGPDAPRQRGGPGRFAPSRGRTEKQP